MAKNPAFPMYASDCLSDERVILMSNRAFGCYIKLLMHQWLEGSIPEQIDVQAKLVGEDKTAYAELHAELKHSFSSHPSSASRLVNKRLYEIAEEQRKFREERSASGKKGVTMRLSRQKQKQAELHAEHDTELKLSSSLSSSIIKKTTRVLVAKKGNAPQVFPVQFSYTTKHHDLAKELNLDLELELNKFRDHHLANNNKSKIKKWDLAFNNWLRNAARFKTTGVDHGRRKETAAERCARLSSEKNDPHRIIDVESDSKIVF